MANDSFKARLWTQDDNQLSGKFKTLVTYYCSGEDKLENKDLCINLPNDGGQIVVSTVSLIKLLKKLKRI